MKGDWTDPDKATRLCGTGELLSFVLGAMFVAAGLIWWAAQCP